MATTKSLGFLCALGLAVTAPALAEVEHNRFGISYGETAHGESVETQATQVFIQKGFTNKRDPDLVPDIELSYGLLESDWGDIERAGLGLGLRHMHNWPLEFRLGANAYYLNKYQIMAPDLSDAVDYGGHWQFGINVGLSVQVNKKIEIGYRFEHMTNGSRYASDPGLITHNVTLFIPIGM